MKCLKCGQENAEGAKFCFVCGESFANNASTYGGNQHNSNIDSSESGSFWWGVLGFFVPLVGLILFFVWLHEKPRSAKAAGIGALVNFIVGIITVIFFLSVIFNIVSNIDHSGGYSSPYTDEWDSDYDDEVIYN